MKIYILECEDQYGNTENNGYYLDINNAIEEKKKIDLYPQNTKYGIEQYINEVETED